MGPVLMVSYSGAFGGAERALIDFAEALDGERCLACPEGPLEAAARDHGIRVFPLAGRSLELRASALDRALAAGRLLLHGRAVRALVADVRPSLVIACGMRSGLVAPAPFVFLHNDMLPGPMIGRLVRAAARRAVLVVVPSAAVANDLGVPAVVVAPGVDLDRFGAANGRASATPTVLTLGAIVPWKQPELALEAVAIARGRQPGLRLRVVGAPLGAGGEALLGRLRVRAEAPDLAGAVDFPGATPDPAAELSSAACLLHCAPREPYGIALVEALAAGRPVVAPAAAGPLEIVDESCGVLYPPGDAPAAAEALLNVLERPALGEAARERARARFGVDAARKRFGEVVASVAAQPSRRARADLTVVTVSHNSAQVLAGMLRSVASHLPGAHVVVVDSGSSDESVAVARRGWGELSVDVIELGRNAGFGVASNRGVHATSADVVALLNPDVELIDDSLLALADEARRRDRLLAPLVLSRDGSRQDSVHPLPTSLADLTRAIVPPAGVPGQAGAALAPWRSRAPRRVGWAIGCAIVARRETLRALGPFDERIFLYGEDLDLGLRARAAGVETWFWPDARVVHHGAHSTRPAFDGEPFELLARARGDAVRRSMGSRRAALDRAAQTVTFGSRLALKRALGRPATRERMQLGAARAAGRRR
jgi:hypothetical protein